MARFLLRANFRRCIVSQMRMASDELGELGKKGSKDDPVGKGEDAEGQTRVEEIYIDYLRRHHQEEIQHHYREIAHLQSSLSRHKAQLRKLKHED